MAQDSSRASQDSLKTAHEVPKIAYEGSKRPPKLPEKLQWAFRESPRGLKPLTFSRILTEFE
eukprot:4406534-Pyramimonas_sp.AAC.1